MRHSHTGCGQDFGLEPAAPEGALGGQGGVRRRGTITPFAGLAQDVRGLAVLPDSQLRGDGYRLGPARRAELRQDV
jgi:hypothetical protein